MAMNLSEELTSVQSAYNTVAESYSKVLPDASFEAPLDRAMIDAFVEYVNTADVSSVLDAGCGAGRMTGLLTTQGAQVSGVDLSPAMIGIARNKPGSYVRRSRSLGSSRQRRPVRRGLCLVFHHPYSTRRTPARVQ